MAVESAEPMAIDLLTGLGVMVLCLVLQISILAWTLLYYAQYQNKLERSSFLFTILVLNGVMIVLVLGNLGQIAIWASLFLWLGEFERFSEAFYHSAVNFSTLGYGDIVMTQGRKLLGPLESVNGILMVGISTAAFMTVLRDAISHSRREWMRTAQPER
ncbi:MAG: potassium channel family protein [Pseudomonadota bacterium]